MAVDLQRTASMTEEEEKAQQHFKELKSTHPKATLSSLMSTPIEGNYP